jgi:general secretion pathway protein D
MTFFTRIAPWTRILGCVLLVGWLAGCSAKQLFNEGLLDIKAGRYEVGLAKIEDAVRKDPDSAFLKTELRLKRAYVIQTLLQDAETARLGSHFAEARQLYIHALDLDRDNVQARKGLELAKTEELNQEEIRMARDLIGHHDLKEAQTQLAHVLSTDPGNLEAKQMLDLLLAQTAQTAQAAPAKPKLRLKDDRLASLDFRETPLNMVFQALSRTSGLNFVLDKDVKGDAKTSIFVKDLSVEAALDLVLAQHTLEKKIMSDNTIFIYPETTEKRRRFEEQMVKSFYLTNTDPKQAMNLLKVMLDTKVLFVDDRAKLLVMRDTPEVIRMAEKLIASIDQEDSEVMMEVEVVEIQRTKLQELGIKYPTQIALTALAPTVAGAAPVTGAAAVTGLLLKDVFTLNTDRVRTSALGATIDLRGEAGQVNLLASPRIRAKNYEKAKILIGSRVPVITNAVTPTSVGSSVVTGSVQYIDVGLKFEVEPTIYRGDEVAMKVNLEVSNIVKEVQNPISGTLAYEIGTRTAVTVLRLRDGETQVLGGLINDEDRESASKVPGLSSIPVLGRLFSSQRNTINKTEIVLSITPHIIRHGERLGASTSQFSYGTESARGIPMMFKAGEDSRNPLPPAKGAPEAASVLPVAPALRTESGAGPAAAGNPTATLPAAGVVGPKATEGQPASPLPGGAPPIASPENDAIVPAKKAPETTGLPPAAPALGVESDAGRAAAADPAAPLPAAAAVGAEPAGGQPASPLPTAPPPVASPGNAAIVPLKGAPEAAGLPPAAPALGMEPGAGFEAAGKPTASLPAAAAAGAKAAGGQPASPLPGGVPPVASPGNAAIALPKAAPAPSGARGRAQRRREREAARNSAAPLPAPAAAGAKAAGSQPASPLPGGAPPIASPENAGTVPATGDSEATDLPQAVPTPEAESGAGPAAATDPAAPLPVDETAGARAAGDQPASPSPDEPPPVASPEKIGTVR